MFFTTDAGVQHFSNVMLPRFLELILKPKFPALLKELISKQRVKHFRSDEAEVPCRPLKFLV
jgi:hypothetical protein